MNSETVEKWLDYDPLEVALKTGNREIAQRVDLLQKARVKLPSYFKVRAVFSQIMFEQSTSEAVASSREYKGGNLAIDLTAGLGVDSYYLSKEYKHVISVEIDKERAEFLTENFKLLKVSNVEVINSSAEDFIEHFEGDKIADLIFIDPARRDESGGRLYDIRRTKPDVLNLLPKLMSKTKELRIKCSPMADVNELQVIFGPDFSVETISLDGECKETVVRYDGNNFGKNIVTVLSSEFGRRTFAFDYGEDVPELLKLEDAKYLCSFDTSLVKSRTSSFFLRKYFPSVHFAKAGSYLLTDTYVDDECVRCRAIKTIEPYHPKKLRTKLGGKKISVLRKGFPVSMDLLKKQIGFKEGGNETIAFVEVNRERYMLVF